MNIYVNFKRIKPKIKVEQFFKQMLKVIAYLKQELNKI